MPSQLVPVTLTALQRPVRAELEDVLPEIGRIVAADFPLVDDVNDHLLRLKGKLFRPTLLLLSARTVERLSARKVTLAAVLELIHVATLVHDDSVDHSALRRGEPTVNALFSHQVAVIMGDYLYSRAIVELVDLGDLETLRVMSRVTNDMTVGEMRELEAHDALDYSEDAYQAMIRAKTASLLAAACEVGGIDADPGSRRALRRYGDALGMAFQITDDLLDYTATEAQAGKPTGVDLREHKITLPLIAALPRMTVTERREVEALMAEPAPDDAAVALVTGIVRERGGVEEARGRAAEFAERAAEELGELPAVDAREALADAITYAVERQS